MLIVAAGDVMWFFIDMRKKKDLQSSAVKIFLKISFLSIILRYFQVGIRIEQA